MNAGLEAFATLRRGPFFANVRKHWADNYDQGDEGKTAESVAHSSVAFAAKKSVLSAAGACCVARHHREDYEAIATLLQRDVGCRGRGATACRAALRSMLDRRAGQHNATAASCAALMVKQAGPGGRQGEGLDKGKRGGAKSKSDGKQNQKASKKRGGKKAGERRASVDAAVDSGYD